MTKEIITSDNEADDDQNEEDEAGVEKRDTICRNL